MLIKIFLFLKNTIFISLVTINLGCELSPTVSERSLAGIYLSWEQIVKDSHEVLAFFSIENSTKDLILKDNWSLYFSQMPRRVSALPGESNCVLENLGGDYYCLKPLPGFELLPGQKKLLIYRLNWPLLKISDCPRGLFWVVRGGGREEVFQVKNFELKPLKLSTRLGYYYLDQEPEPTLKNCYYKNQENIALAQKDWQLVIPRPKSLVCLGDPFILDTSISLVYQTVLENEALYLKERMRADLGLDLKVNNDPEAIGPTLSLRVAPIFSTSNQAYELIIGRDGIVITGNGRQGVFYGIQSLLSLISFEDIKGKRGCCILPCLFFKDEPRFNYRGLHLDVSRNFQTKEEIKKIIDLMACYKLNYLHLHLSDDEGFRLEIDSLPELTQVGAKRGYSSSGLNMLPPAWGSGPFAEPSLSSGSGFFSRRDFIEILRYAGKRYITVIPEIDLPAHARAAIIAMEARYKNYLAQNKLSEALAFRLIDGEPLSLVGGEQDPRTKVVDVSLESVYNFFELIVAELALMYEEAGLSFSCFHTGGDEVPASAWLDSVGCHRLKKDLGLTDISELQGYFFERIRQILAKYKLTAGAWQEAVIKNRSLQLDLAGQVLVYVWNNLEDQADVAYRLANAGYEVVLAAASHLYFDQAYSRDPLEPGLYWAGSTDLKEVWSFKPYFMLQAKKVSSGTALKSNAQKNILGIQAQLWSETIDSAQRLEYYLLPRLLGLAERAWSPQPAWEIDDLKDHLLALQQKEWLGFLNALAGRELPKLAYRWGGFNYRLPPPGAIFKDGLIEANTEYPFLSIFYKEDGSEDSRPLPVAFKPAGPIWIFCRDRAGHLSRMVLINPGLSDNR